jgi:hypothetical protein
MSCHFIGYPEKSKGCHFYCPDRHTKFVEMRHIIFLEDEMMRGSTFPREISLEEKRVYVLRFMSKFLQCMCMSELFQLLRLDLHRQYRM